MDNTNIEAREELMVSPSSIENKARTILPLEIRYNGWRPPTKEWKKWVKKLQPKFEYLWIQTGIFHAIKASTYEIKRDDELVLELANRWCSNTNTFVFSWGKSTITLEDIEVCFGYSLLGSSISNPLMNCEQEKAEKELTEARRMFNCSKAKKVNQRAWMMYFMETESKGEHEAFLVYWLSRFVFPADSYDTISKSVIPVAVHLARGNRVALAPAVLTSINRDLSLLNSVITKKATTTIKSLRVTIWAPIQLVQIWALERFLVLSPRPCTIGHGLPKVARWDGVKVLKNKNLKKDLNIAGFGNDFLWQPYANSPSVNVYNEKDMWKCYNPWWKQKKSSEERDNKRVKVEDH
ncbi:protein MAIN-LIKE 2-like [Vicia villosa]|uniref:protein MAIN-LIKE 2-like n=1 Tax=Vicia villosa TaxID=3911 RepID=UPI00273ABC23|nr:protein MAIN-LIKE 2-like [Vicia villosa]